MKSTRKVIKVMVDPKTGKPSDKSDAITKNAFDKRKKVDPITGEPSNASDAISIAAFRQRVMVDPETGEPSDASDAIPISTFYKNKKVDPVTGEPSNSSNAVTKKFFENNQMVDPKTGKPSNKSNAITRNAFNKRQTVDPITNKPSKKASAISKSTLYRNKSLVDPETGLPSDADNAIPRDNFLHNRKVDPKTGEPSDADDAIPLHRFKQSRKVDPTTGEPSDADDAITIAAFRNRKSRAKKAKKKIEEIEEIFSENTSPKHISNETEKTKTILKIKLNKNTSSETDKMPSIKRRLDATSHKISDSGVESEKNVTKKDNKISDSNSKIVNKQPRITLFAHDKQIISKKPKTSIDNISLNTIIETNNTNVITKNIWESVSETQSQIQTCVEKDKLVIQDKLDYNNNPTIMSPNEIYSNVNYWFEEDINFTNLLANNSNSIKIDNIENNGIMTKQSNQSTALSKLSFYSKANEPSLELDLNNSELDSFPMDDLFKQF